MGEKFDYDKVFMGVTPGKRKDYHLSVKDDYRLEHLTEAVRGKFGKLIDLGCGGGLLTESLVYYYPKTKIYGCDVSRTAISYAKKFGSGKVVYNVIKSKKLPYKNNFSDVCICLDVLEHVPDVDFFLKEVKRILKKDGRFFLIVPCEGQPFTYTWLFQKIKRGDKLTQKNWGHIHPEFTHKNIEDLLIKHEFFIERKTYGDHIFYQLFNLLPYFLVKEIMDLVLGKNAQKYYDRGIVDRVVKQERNTDIFDLIRGTWLFWGGILSRAIISTEMHLLKKVPFTAWKIFIYSGISK
ncbi:MAG: class I SAM-dependent methyltransferase [Candidatus Blackburnbacteria bacterium]|nr:class I SAM-dependent methyltransferase [Candidatus Blackburnbacteria bacterium]